MSESLDGVGIAAAIRSQGAQEQYYRAINRRLLLMGYRLGIDGDFDDDPISPGTQKGTPAQAGLAVVPVDGSFQITITLPQDVPAPSVTVYQNYILRERNKLRAVMMHQLQSATTVLFDAASNVLTYGPFTETYKEIQMPNVTLFWRVRSSYDGTNWNDWLVYSSPTTCGPVAVSSGVLRTTANALSNVASTPVGNLSPLTQVGLTTQISVAASVWKVGGVLTGGSVVPNLISYNSGSANPGTAGKWFVYADDPGRVGGTVTYVPTADPADITGHDGRLYFGSITLATSGSGGGSGGGGGAGGCVTGEVMIEMADGSQKRMATLNPGDTVQGIDGPEKIVRLQMIPNQSCISFALDNGMVLAGCSGSHPLKHHAAAFQTAFEVNVGDLLQTRKGPAKVVKKTAAGVHTVYKVTLDGNRVFFTDGLVSHNALLK